MRDYIPRICDEELLLKLEAFGAVHVVGPKWCGKTTTAKRFAKSFIEMQDPDKRDTYLETAKVKPSNLLVGDNPRLIDEWQIAPNLWDAVRVSVDRRNEDGLYILTSSNSIDRSEIMHTGTGRIDTLVMYPMSLFESGESNGTVSLKELFNTGELPEGECVSQLSVDDLIFAACRGGWPSSLRKKSKKARLLVAQSYFEGLCREDVSNMDGVSRDETATRLILRSYARNVSTLASNRSIIRDVNANYEIGDTTFYEYVKALKKLYVIQDVEAWSPAIRSKSSIQASDKKEFVDPSLVVAALGVEPEYFNLDLKTFGFIFETLCIRDLKIYSNALGGRVSYYRDRYGLEADAVLHLRDGRYALIEFKLGSADVDEGARHLLEIERLVAAYNEKEKQVRLRAPDLKIVITGTEYGYRRPDGVFVIPIGTLRN
ncbi:MAG: ATP-binding protein [Thermoguttaceae bacterium]|nr:ATP-binding protein [Thermoguttaceae bacterium]